MEQLKYNILVAVLLGFVCLATAANNGMRERFGWNVVDFEYPSEEARSLDISTGEFIPENNLPLGIERWRNKLFVTVSKFRAGVPSTLNYIDLDATYDYSPKLKPYPNWETNQIRRNNGFSKLANVYRVNVDACDRLWALDAGVIDLLGTNEIIHPPKLQVYDLNDDRLLFEYTLPESVTKEDSLFVNLVVDIINNDCNNAYVYIADVRASALVVYHLASNDAWRISHSYFTSDPLSTDYNIGGLNFQWPDSLIGIALSSLQADGFRTFYFHPLSSTYEFSVSTRILQNKTAASTEFHAYKVVGNRGLNSQSLTEAYDPSTGVLFYTLVQKNALACWNTEKNYTTESAIVASDPFTMAFPNGVKVDETGTLWLLSNRLSHFFYSTLNLADINFRILSASTEQLIRGTVCEGPKLSSFYNQPQYVDLPSWNSVLWNPYIRRIIPNKPIPIREPVSYNSFDLQRPSFTIPSNKRLNDIYDIDRYTKIKKTPLPTSSSILLSENVRNEFRTEHLVV